MSHRNLPVLGEDGRILEGVATTLNQDGSVNISPMGPIVDPELSTLVFRPFQTSTTFLNMQRSRQGVFHITDDVNLIAQAAVGTPAPLPRLVEAEQIDGRAIADACRCYEFRVESIDDREDRATVLARVEQVRRNRDFIGFNRAQHAVLEAAILATRIHLLPAEEVERELSRLQVMVTKTASRVELQAMKLLCDYIADETVAGRS